MPVRQRPEKKVFGGPQGEDAFVVVKRLTVEESNAFTEQFQSLEASATDGETRANNEMIARKAIADLVLDWNLVDNDDKPLPKPYQNADVFGQLYNEELTWITKALVNQTDEQQAAAKKKGK